MKRVIVFLVFVLSFVSCSKMKCEYTFDKEGGIVTRDIEIDGNTLKIQSGSECSDTPWRQDEGTENESFYVALNWAYAYYHPARKSFHVYVSENTTGHDRYFTVSGSLNGKETSFTFRQHK